MWSRVCRGIGAVGVILVLASAFTPLPNVLAGWMGGGDSRAAQAIVVLAGAGVAPGGVLSDSSARRAFHGIALFRQQLAPRLVFSAATRDEAEARAAVATALGVFPQAITLVVGSRTTREEAHHTRQLLEPRGVRSILLVTDPVHMPRSLALFQRAGFEVVPSPTDDEGDRGSGPEGRLQLMRAILAEVLARLYNFALREH